MSTVGPSYYLASSLPTVPLQEVVARNGQELSKLSDTVDCLKSQVKAQFLKDSALKDLRRLFRQAEPEKNTQLSYLEQRVEIKSTQTEQAIFNSQEFRLRLSKVGEEKANIEFQVRIEEHQTSLQIQALQDQVSQMKVQHDQSEEAT